MAGHALAARIERLRPSPRATVGLAALVVLQLLLLAIFLNSPVVGEVIDPVQYAVVLLQPLVWIDVGLLAVLTTDPPGASARRRRLGLAVAAGYFLVLAYFGGIVGSGTGTGLAGVNWLLPPGYSPRLFYDGAVVGLAIEPYKLVGYGALAYLVYVTVLDAAGAAFSGVVGLFSCVSCTWPIVGTVAASLFGGGSALATAAMNQAYPLSTLVFLSAVALLWWRPSFGGGGGSEPDDADSADANLGSG